MTPAVLYSNYLKEKISQHLMWRKRKNIVSASKTLCVPYLIQLAVTIGMDRWVRVTSSTQGLSWILLLHHQQVCIRAVD